jgi:transposase-like protein
MVYGAVQCPHCHSTEVIKAGKQPKGAQRYRCQNPLCERQLFLLHYQDRGRLPEVRRQVVDMAVKGRGIRDTARVLRISPTTVIAVLKKRPRASPPPRRVATLPLWARRPSPHPVTTRSRNGGKVEFCRRPGQRVVVRARDRSRHWEGLSVCLRPP